MNYPFSTLIVETDNAKGRLTQMFQASADRQAATLSPTQGTSAKGGRSDGANQPRVLPAIFRLRTILDDPGKNKRSANGHYWKREDMGLLSFMLTLVLLGTVAAAQTDQPVRWLLIGPAPLAVGLAVAAYCRQRFNLYAFLRGFRGSCPCQCKKNNL
jgi:hypothetical protein